ncbi:MAG: hypothetical protein DMF92_08605 [Acidobacteria bacterium]|nr:MAG: hypothetical protein DMF92_08605 [Acidobacteriota bacterium]
MRQPKRKARTKEDLMHRLALFAAGVGVLVGTVVMQPGAARAQENKNTGHRLSVVGIAVKDYPKSQIFYETE